MILSNLRIILVLCNFSPHLLILSVTTLQDTTLLHPEIFAFFQILFVAVAIMSRSFWGKVCLPAMTLHQICLIFLFLRKISTELTSAANPPLLLRKTGSELTSVPIFLYFIPGTPTTAWLDKRCHVRTQDLNQQTLGRQSRTCAPLCHQAGPCLISFNPVFL